MSYHINGCCGNEKKNDKYNFINFFLFTNWTSLTISVMKYYFSTFALSVFMSSLNKMLLPATKIQRKLLLDLRIQLFLLPKLLATITDQLFYCWSFEKIIITIIIIHCYTLLYPHTYKHHSPTTIVILSCRVRWQFWTKYSAWNTRRGKTLKK